MMNIDDIPRLLQRVVDNNLIQNEDGSFPAGHNGPHHDDETPVRTTAHTLYMLCWLVDTGLEQYKVKANKAADYLLSHKARPMNASFWCRKNPEKDFSNGLVGQTWVFEALLKASDSLKRDDCYQLVEQVFLMHKWSEQHTAWHTLNVDGSSGVLHGTFNQQLWFAYIGLTLKSKIAKQNSLLFIENVFPTIELYSDGTIFHDSLILGSKLTLKSNLGSNLKRIKHFIKKRKLLKSQRLRSVGYHGFNVTPMIYIKEILPELAFWKTKKYKKIINVMEEQSFINDISSNKFSFPYNPIGFEMAKLFQSLGDNIYAKKLIEMQLNYISISGNKISILETEDVNISLARIYEVCRIDLTRIAK
tara:strand:- start:10802 stop:11884 length:1083 start_codon:yes stop_codon:yes gene_type:complete